MLPAPLLAWAWTLHTFMILTSHLLSWLTLNAWLLPSVLCASTMHTLEPIAKTAPATLPTPIPTNIPLIPCPLPVKIPNLHCKPHTSQQFTLALFQLATNAYQPPNPSQKISASHDSKPVSNLPYFLRSLYVIIFSVSVYDSYPCSNIRKTTL